MSLADFPQVSKANIGGLALHLLKNFIDSAH